MNQKTITKIFDSIAHRYDFLNRFLSGYQDVLWRKRLVSLIPQKANLEILDLATGTGDVLFEILSSQHSFKRLVGVDLSDNMIAMAQKKAQKISENRLCFERANAEKLPFNDNAFDVVTVSFGIRNMPHYRSAIDEAHRVLKDNGLFLILEFSLPQNYLFRSLYLLYFRHILPRVGGVISGNYKAYRYLNTSVEDFLQGEVFCNCVRERGFRSVKRIPLTLGVASIYCAEK